MRARQQRSVDTRQRLYEAAMAEFERVGVAEARVEDIVATAGVSWGSFFHHFPRKEDVLLAAAVGLTRAFTARVNDGIGRGEAVERTAAAAFRAMRAAAAGHSDGLRAAMAAEVVGRPDRLRTLLGEDEPDLTDALARLLEVGQQRGEIRTDLPVRSMAVVVATAVLGSGRQTLEQRVRSRAASPRMGTVAFRLVFAGLRPPLPVSGGQDTASSGQDTAPSRQDAGPSG
jgi:AcrR family transcriptional regulator